MRTWKVYAQVKRLVGQYFILREDKNYEEFIRELIDVLGL